MITFLRRAARSMIGATARDLTAQTATRTALVLAPHPDDETLGCGATILRKTTQGTAVTVAVLTDGSASHHSPTLSSDRLRALRHAEMAEAGRRLHLPGPVRWAPFRDGELSSREDEVAQFVTDLIAELDPDEVYATSALETHPDHSTVGRAARRAVAANPRVSLLEYPVWLWGAWPLRRGARIGSVLEAAAIAARRGRVVQSTGHLEGKLHALDAHETQLRRPPSVPEDEEWAVLPPSVIEAASARRELFFAWRPSRTGR